MEKSYAKAIDSLLASGMKEEDVVKKLLAHLRESGRMKLLPQLLRELETQAKRKQGREPMLEVASESEVKAAEKEAGTDVKASVNPDLISGWRLTTADTLIDRSGKRALIDLYRKVTT
jgi:F0F1-type ATP synthase delta subunit